MTPAREKETEKKGLAALGAVALSPVHQELLERVGALCGGTELWRHRKLAELRDVLALAQLADRLRVLEVDAREDLRLKVAMRADTPCLPDSRGELRVERHVCLGIVYREAALYMPQPGASFVQILAPRAVWHPNCGQPAQMLCLGNSLPRCIRVSELILLSYGALTLQNVGLGENGEGVMNGAAALWWIANSRRMPLTQECFLLPKD